MFIRRSPGYLYALIEIAVVRTHRVTIHGAGFSIERIACFDLRSSINEHRDAEPQLTGVV